MSAPAIPSPSRPPSTPAAGAVRFSVQASVAAVVFYNLRAITPAEIGPEVNLLVSVFVGSTLAAAGKWLRDRGFDVVPF